MDYKLEEKEGCVRKYSFNMGWNEIQDDYELALKKIVKEAEVPGFRKGKAPIEIVKAKYKNPIEGELKSRLLQKVVSEIVEKEKLKLFSDPGADSPSFVDGGGFSGFLYFEVYPEVPEIEYGDLEIKISKDKVTQTQIDQMTEIYRARHAEIKTMDNEIVQEGDFCAIKITPEKGGEEESVFLKCSTKSFDVIEKSLIGKKCGEVYDLEIGENQQKPKGRYRVVVSNVVRRVLPVLNDDLAKKSGFSSLEELMAKSKEKAEQENELRNKEERNKAIVKALLDKYKFDIPFTLLDRQLKKDAEALANELSRQGRNLNDHDWNKYFELRKVAVENNIKAYFIVSKLIEQEKVQISNEDIDAFLKDIAENEGLALEKVKEILEKNGQIEDIKFKLAEEKALENVSNYVKINYVEETPEKEKGGNDVDSDSR